MSDMAEIFTCRNSEQFGDGSPAVRLPNNEITVLIRDELPGMSRKQLTDDIMDAWALWAQVIGITVKLWLPEQGGKPTQVVTVHDFGDGISGIQADQQLPFGNGTNLVMRIDVPTGKRNREERIAIYCHENGHCLGMSHANPSDGVPDLMDPVLSTIHVPQAGDITVARKMGYGPPGDKQPAPTKGRYIELKEQDEAGTWWTCSGYFKRAQ